MLAPSVELALVFVLQRLLACLHKTIQVNKEIRPFIYFEGFFLFHHIQKTNLSKTMNFETVRDYCLSLPLVTEDFPFDDQTLAFRIMTEYLRAWIWNVLSG